MTVREGLRIEISGIPAENGKCRVETQLKITLHLKGAAGEAIKDWKQLRLPHPLIAKEKHRMDKFNGRNKHIQDAEILTLEAKLVCDHDRTKVLECCESCIARERKRAHRRKESQKLPGPSPGIPVFGSVNPKHSATLLSNESVPPTPTDPVEYQLWERRRIMVFSCTEYVDISSGQCLLPTRITCYCRHHNEKVGFRIQFTARDSTGASIATVLTNPVMMMDDHKSGKRLASALARNGAASSSATKRSSVNGSDQPNSNNGVSNGDLQAQQQDSEDEQDDMDHDEGGAEDQEEIDLEAGHHIPQHGFTGNEKFEDSEILSGDVLTPLTSSFDRTGAKRRVDENMMEDIQPQSNADSSRGPFRRKTSHDPTSATASMPSLFASSAIDFGASSTLPTQSPFMPGSPFAQDGQGNLFTPSFSQSMLGGESFLDQKNIDMFLQTSMSTIPATRRNEPFQGLSKDLTDQDSSMMEFTTLDEAVASSLDDGRTPHAADAPSPTQGQGNDQASVSSTSQAFSIQGTSGTSAPDFSFSAIPLAVGSNPFSTAGMLNSAFSTTFSAPLNGTTPTPTLPTTAVTAMPSSFLDASQIQEFQNFKRQSMLQTQDDILAQLQQGVQSQQPIETKPVPWTADSKDPFYNMKMAMSQTTSPLSSAFIPDSMSLTENGIGEAQSKLALDNDGAEAMGVISATTPAGDTSFAPKKRGRPRKPALSSSQPNSPVLSPKTAEATLPPSPSPPPLPSPTSTSSTTAAAAAAAATQFMLIQQRQQQQFHQHQQQLQQQQKQAILARQKPRIQKAIPGKGPVEGGIEITLLGSGFFPGMVPTFDGIPALNVQYYGPETMICRLPARKFPGPVLVKAQNPLSALAVSAAAAGAAGGLSAAVGGSGLGRDEGQSSDLVRTMAQLFGGPSSVPSNNLFDDDVGAWFEYEETKGDRDLIALALQVLGMKMNGRVEPPHQVALRIMGTAAASNSGTAGQIGSSSQGQLQLPQQHQQALQPFQLPSTQQQLLGFGGGAGNGSQLNGGVAQQGALQQQQQQVALGSLPPQSTSMVSGSLLGAGMLGFGNFMNSMGGPSSGGSF